MPGESLTIIAIVGAVTVALAGVLLIRRRMENRKVELAGTLDQQNLHGSGVSPDLRNDAREVIAIPTDQPNELYLFGPSSEIDRYGSSLAKSPSQLCRYAIGLREGLNAVQSHAEFSGRLVLVDDKTAAALKSGAMMRSKSGEILAHVLRSDKKVSSVTRLREVGGLAANAASLTGALSAMAMQAQLDRIERQLSEISRGLDQTNRELPRGWHAHTLGAQDVLREVYRTASHAGELTSSNWSQIAPIGYVIRTQVNGDRSRLADAVADLERLTQASDVKERRKELASRVAAVRNAHGALSESTRAWAQYSALRLWHFTVTSDPTLEAYRNELREFMDQSREEVEPVRKQVARALERAGETRWTSRVRHPRISRQLPDATASQTKQLESMNWQLLELRPPTRELEPGPSDGDSTE